MFAMEISNDSLFKWTKIVIFDMVGIFFGDF